MSKEKIIYKGEEWEVAESGALPIGTAKCVFIYQIEKPKKFDNDKFILAVSDHLLRHWNREAARLTVNMVDTKIEEFRNELKGK